MADSPGGMTTRKWIAVLGSALGAFMAVLDIQITNSSLAQISGGVGATADEGSWISTAYLIGEIVTIALTAWFARVFTVRYYMLANIVLFLIFSCLCGISTSLGEIIVFRVGQGLTGGVMIPMSLTLIVSLMPKNLQPIGQTIFGLTATLAPAIGPYVGGWLTDNYGWEWNFYINLFPGALMFAAIAYAVEAQPLKLDLLKGGDWWGMVCMAIGLGSFITMLEEGQRKDWFGNDLIRNCGVLAAIFIPAFIIIEFIRANPFVNLRLLASRNLAIGAVVGSLLGMGLYGTVYLIPLYLDEVQRYSPFQIGQTLIWVGMPQLLIFPLLPLLMKRFDIRAVVCFGGILFGASCFMNAFMSPDYAHDQFVVANVVRALGQPFTIVPVTTLALGTITAKDAGDGSAIFNIARNLGGSVGIALLSTVVTRREQLHDFRLGERVSLFDPATQGRIAEVMQGFVAKGSDAVTATSQAYQTIKLSMTRNANVMAFSDAFYIVGWLLIVGAVLVWFCKKPKPGASSEAA